MNQILCAGLVCGWQKIVICLWIIAAAPSKLQTTAAIFAISGRHGAQPGMSHLRFAMLKNR